MKDAKGLIEDSTPLPWAWRGHANGSVELRSPNAMGMRVITTMRADPCIVAAGSSWDDYFPSLTPNACGPCRSYFAKKDMGDRDEPCAKPENLDTVWLNNREFGFVEPANKFAVREVPYRDDVVDVNHPDAALIVYAVNHLPDYEAAVDALERLVGAVEGAADAQPTETDGPPMEAARAALRRLRGEP